MSTASHSEHHSVKPYIVGYILSLILTVAAFGLYYANIVAVGVLIVILLALAVLQIFVQLFFFMHVTEGEGPHYHVMALVVGALIVVTIIGGSIWIMAFNSYVA